MGSGMHHIRTRLRQKSKKKRKKRKPNREFSLFLDVLFLRDLAMIYLSSQFIFGHELFLIGWLFNIFWAAE